MWHSSPPGTRLDAEEYEVDFPEWEKLRKDQQSPKGPQEDVENKKNSRRSQDSSSTLYEEKKSHGGTLAVQMLLANVIQRDHTEGGGGEDLSPKAKILTREEVALRISSDLEECSEFGTIRIAAAAANPVHTQCTTSDDLTPTKPVYIPKKVTLYDDAGDNCELNSPGTKRRGGAVSYLAMEAEMLSNKLDE